LTGVSGRNSLLKEKRMPDDKEKELTPTAKRVYGKVRLPHKFCPYCGHRNEAGAEACENCGKDISWMRVPEPIPYAEAPKQKPKNLPKQRRTISGRALIVTVIIIAILIAVIIVLIVTLGTSKGAPAVGVGVILPAALVRARTGPGWDFALRQARGADSPRGPGRPTGLRRG
jgi:ribosomal protein L32